MLAAVTALASRLVAEKLGADSKIPVLARNSASTIIAYLAILKIGGCYIPLDVENWSEERIEGVLRIIPYSRAIRITSATDLEEAIELVSPTSAVVSMPFDVTSCDRLAYIIFTSGSTGVPKGVMISCANIEHYVQQGHEEAPFNLDVQPGDVILSVLSVAFDGK